MLEWFPCFPIDHLGSQPVLGHCLFEHLFELTCVQLLFRAFVQSFQKFGLALNRFCVVREFGYDIQSLLSECGGSLAVDR